MLFSRYFLSLCLISVFFSTLFPEKVYSQEEQAVRDTSYVRMLNEQALELLKSENTDSAKVLIDEALSMAVLLNDVEGEAKATTNLANYYLDRGRPSSVIELLEVDFERFLSSKSAVPIGNLLGTAYSRVGKYSESLEMYLRTRELARERGDDRMVMGITQNLGNTYSSLGDIPEAIDSYLTSLELAEEARDTLVIAVVLDNLAAMNTQLENYELAEEYLLRALELNKSLDNRNNQITNYMSLGVLYKGWEKFDLAEENYNKVLEIAEELDNVITEIQGLYNFGLLYHETEDYERAMTMFERSLEMSREYEIGIGVFYNQNGMANVYSDLENYEKAADLFEEALTIAESVGAQDLIRETVRNLHETYESMGDTLSAYPYLKRYTAMQDSLADTERENALARQEVELGLRLERENRELAEAAFRAEERNLKITISLLALLLIVLAITIWLYRNKIEMNRKLRSQTEELMSVNKEKDRLLSVLSHDLRSPLSNIQGVVYLIRENVLKGKDINKALDEIDAKLQGGINTLTNYLQWAQTQSKGIEAKIEHLDLHQTVQHVIDEFSTVARKKDIVILNNVQLNTKALGDPQLLSVILRNLISNAVKFVPANGSGKVTVAAKETKTMVEMHVKDNGEGIDENQKKNIFKAFKPGAKDSDGKMGTGLGLSICKDLAEKQGGSIHFESEAGSGTTFIVEMKKESAAEPAGKS